MSEDTASSLPNPAGNFAHVDQLQRHGKIQCEKIGNDLVGGGGGGGTPLAM